MTQITDQRIEQEIQAKGLIAPRVTPEHIEGIIVSDHYFTGAQGDAKAVEDAAFSGGAINAAASRATPESLKHLTFCILVLRNGFTVTGESACASPENFDAEIGRKIARQNAVNKIWQLEGYLLKQRLYEQSLSEPLPDDVESIVLTRDQRVKINGIPFFLMGDVKAATGKGGTALAFEPQPECSE
ncbi:hypothetical protein PEC301619_04910 [Pectobacterium carotovorum subsp. carotovorum]|nr:hypothetical protein PEC301619_04910 [Pectobacterium carotovorum subsp. carotovorum]